MEVYGYSELDEPVEVVNAKLRVIGLLEKPGLIAKEPTGESNPRTVRRVYYETDESWHNVDVYDRTHLGGKVDGPVIIEQYDSTTVVYPGWSAEPDNYGNLILRRSRN